VRAPLSIHSAKGAQSGPPIDVVKRPLLGPPMDTAWKLGAQRAPNEDAHGALGPPIKIISGNPGTVPIFKFGKK
jgi:hypothetical protein